MLTWFPSIGHPVIRNVCPQNNTHLTKTTLIIPFLTSQPRTFHHSKSKKNKKKKRGREQWPQLSPVVFLASPPQGEWPSPQGPNTGAYSPLIGPRLATEPDAARRYSDRSPVHRHPRGYRRRCPRASSRRRRRAQATERRREPCPGQGEG